MHGGVKGGSDEPWYSGALSFLRRRYSRDLDNREVDVVVTGVPFDMATSNRPGARFGPAGIRAASVNLAWEEQRWPWDFKVFDHLGVIDYGDLFFNYGEPQSFLDGMQAHADNVLAANKTMLTLGGDHFIALPLVRAHAKKYGALSLLHFDAHTDTYSHGTGYDHGTMFYHAANEGVVDPSRSVQIGIRTTYEKENHRYNVLDAAWVNDNGPSKTLDRIINIIGDAPVYLSFDIDGLDPAYAPGTGTPVCGGLSTDCALKIIRGLKPLNLVGMDLVEVAPPYDHAEITSLAAATLCLEFLCVLAAKQLK
ncbi:MAG TPA: agmatinase [Gammaproteobacteria bacterium]